MALLRMSVYPPPSLHWKDDCCTFDSSCDGERIVSGTLVDLFRPEDHQYNSSLIEVRHVPEAEFAKAFLNWRRAAEDDMVVH